MSEHVIWRVLPPIAGNGDPAIVRPLVTSNRQRIGLAVRNLADSTVYVLDQTGFPAAITGRLPIAVNELYQFRPPFIPQNRLFIHHDVAVGSVQLYELLRVSGEDYQAMQEAISAAGRIPVIGA